MEILASNFQPLKTEYKNFNDKFFELMSESKNVDIAVGYISEHSLENLADFIFKHGGPVCNLAIGMHYFEKFTHSQYVVAKEVEKFLQQNKLGSVKLVRSFPFHGKAYSFRKQDNTLQSIIGSSNLGNISFHKPIRQYELDIFVDDPKINQEINNFVNNIINLSLDISNPDIELTDFKQTNNLLEGLIAVKKIDDPRDLTEIKNKIIKEKIIKIPLKTYEEAPKSNINACFGKGRKNKNEIIRERPWYEVELIVPKSITGLEWYPKAGEKNGQNIIIVITDDGYEFRCKISGDYNKNFRSNDDLRILGKWLKGRLENAGVLKLGEAVIKETLEKYGKKEIILCPTEVENTWFMDFSAQMGK